MSRFKIGDKVEITVHRTESDFNRACDNAYSRAIECFGIDEDGHSSIVAGWERSCCSIELQFVSYIRTDNEHTYKFKAKTTKCES